MRKQTLKVSDSDSLLSMYVEFNIYECGKLCKYYVMKERIKVSVTSVYRRICM
ncbi:hypothetical protein HanXRQr2_Chr08g0335451 [Helianthus annuus]|uniref:Uncharacterized protein n=1 Tax=Helianthus annuus TaxID=4232 RepID=A0A9K3IDT7_HELAN|nr:hypothetical protein HanXRQr2_Chr08g0335451 [Helianthus annuus]KAJ0901327.1 hypothetical protein HanPSC8_Chr08g0324071 [Helianthus annuus]